MVNYLPRASWGARSPRSGPGNLTISRVEGVALHWPGMGDSRVIKQGDVARRLRGWQDYHMDDREWSDIAYQVAVDQAGRAWTLRGLRTQSGANGSADVNERFGAILLVVGTGEHPSPEMIATTREVIADFREIYPHGTAIKPHSAVRPDGTDCPGDLVRELITAGAFTPGSHTEEDEMTPAQMTELKNHITAEARRWAIYINLYGLQTEDEREAARNAYDAAKAAGKSDAEASAAAWSKLRGLAEALEKAQKA